MDAAQVKALATELERTLRLPAELIIELRSHRAEGQNSVRVAELPAVLLRADAEIEEILGGIRLTREAIEAHAVDRIRDTKDKLSNVTITTESATLELMNGLDRSLALINTLESQADGAAPSDGFESLRGEVSTLYNHLQFQDITAQQLQGVGFDSALGHGPAADLLLRAADHSSAHLPFNPEATMKRSRADQAAIDEAFKGARNGNASTSGCAVLGARR